MRPQSRADRKRTKKRLIHETLLERLSLSYLIKSLLNQISPFISFTVSRNCRRIWGPRFNVSGILSLSWRVSQVQLRRINERRGVVYSTAQFRRGIVRGKCIRRTTRGVASRKSPPVSRGKASPPPRRWWFLRTLASGFTGR